MQKKYQDVVEMSICPEVSSEFGVAQRRKKIVMFELSIDIKNGAA